MIVVGTSITVWIGMRTLGVRVHSPGRKGAFSKLGWTARNQKPYKSYTEASPIRVQVPKQWDIKYIQKKEIWDEAAILGTWTLGLRTKSSRQPAYAIV